MLQRAIAIFATIFSTFAATSAHGAEVITTNAGTGWTQCPPQNRATVRPGCVHDGDTFWYSGIKYRFACIDAAELASPDGLKARDLLISVLNRPGTTITDIGVIDPYKRHLAIVSGADQKMLEAGLAVDPDYSDARRFCRKK